MALPNAVYAVVALPTLAKNVVVASTGTSFGSFVRARVLATGTPTWAAVTRARAYAINTDVRYKVSLPTLAKDVILASLTRGATWQSDGAATTDWAGIATRVGAWQADGAATTDWTAAVNRTSTWEADGSGTADWSAAVARTATWQSDGSGTRDWIAGVARVGTWQADGTSERNWAWPITLPTTDATWQSDGDSERNWAGTRLGATEFDINGTCTRVWLATKTAVATWQSDGSSTTQFTGPVNDPGDITGGGSIVVTGTIKNWAL